MIEYLGPPLNISRGDPIILQLRRRSSCIVTRDTDKRCTALPRQITEMFSQFSVRPPQVANGARAASPVVFLVSPDFERYICADRTFVINYGQCLPDHRSDQLKADPDLVHGRIRIIDPGTEHGFKGRGPFRYRRLSLWPAKLPRLPVPPVARQIPESASTSSSMGAVLTCLCNPTAAKAGGSGT